VRIPAALFMLCTAAAACKRGPALGAPRSEHPPAPAASSRAIGAPESEPVPFLVDGCPAGEHEVRNWKRIDPASVTDDQRSSLNYSPCSWTVFVRDGVLVARAHHDTRPPVPPGFRLPDQWGPPLVVRRGRSGVLFGFNHGEWGGSLLWYSENATFKRELLDENVVEVLPVANGFTIFTGLSHLGSDTGRATEITDTGTSYELGRSADLGSAPCAVVGESTGAVLVATMAGIIRVRPDFQVEQLLSSHWGILYPVSLALHSKTAYVGMRGIVAEVHLGADAVRETWLSPVPLK
jgi:hypothetical protein